MSEANGLTSQLSTLTSRLSLIEIAQQEHAHGVLLCFIYGVGDYRRMILVCEGNASYPIFFTLLGIVTEAVWRGLGEASSPLLTYSPPITSFLTFTDLTDYNRYIMIRVYPCYPWDLIPLNNHL